MRYEFFMAGRGYDVIKLKPCNHPCLLGSVSCFIVNSVFSSLLFSSPQIKYNKPVHTYVSKANL